MTIQHYRSGYRLLSVLALCIIILFCPMPANSQPGDAEQSRLEQAAQTAAARSDFPEALRLQRLAIANMDRTAPLSYSFRSFVRYQLGALMNVAGQCRESIPVFRESGALVRENPPVNPSDIAVDDWFERDLASFQGVAMAHICLAEFEAAVGEVELARTRFGRRNAGHCVKSQIEAAGGMASFELQAHAAVSYFDRALRFLENCDQAHVLAMQADLRRMRESALAFR